MPVLRRLGRLIDGCRGCRYFVIFARPVPSTARRSPWRRLGGAALGAFPTAMPAAGAGVRRAAFGGAAFGLEPAAQKVLIPLADRSYPVFVGKDLLRHTARLAPVRFARTPVVVSDRHVGPLYLDSLAQALGHPASALPVELIRPGERSKTVGTARRLWSFFLDAGLRRDGCVIALGGGVVGDVAGFAAATYMRGVPVLHVPTSLVAQVDASIGGKTGVNLPAAKNMIGVFHQPAAVVCSVDVLRTLPGRHYRSGLSEVVKTAVVGDPGLFELLERCTASVRRRDLDALENIVVRCARVKGAVVARDERDTNGRAVLNFGHTLGHALEEAAGFRRWTHGSAVAVGMAWAADFSVDEGICTPEDASRLCRLLSTLGLPTSLPAGSLPALLSLMRIDKKARAGGVRVVVMESVGVCRVTEPVPERKLRSSLERFCDRGVSV